MKKKPNLIKSHADAWSAMTQELLRDWIMPSMVNRKPPTKAQLAKWEKEDKARKLKEEKRRAKKITMTVGEFEDKIAEAEARYSDY